MDHSPFTAVYRGRIVAANDRQHVQGFGIVFAGCGGGRVNTVTTNDFWVRTQLGDVCCQMGQLPLPPMLPNHAVTVIVADTDVCAVANHSTGVQCCYRPKRVYRAHNGGCLFLLLALLILGPLEIATYLSPRSSQPLTSQVIATASIAAVVLWGVWVGYWNLSATKYNADLDQKLQTLIAFDRAEVVATGWDARPQSLPPQT